LPQAAAVNGEGVGVEAFLAGAVVAGLEAAASASASSVATRSPSASARSIGWGRLKCHGRTFGQFTR
jgi:hypothetical protein